MSVQHGQNKRPRGRVCDREAPGGAVTADLSQQRKEKGSVLIACAENGVHISAWARVEAGVSGAKEPRICLLFDVTERHQRNP